MPKEKQFIEKRDHRTFRGAMEDMEKLEAAGFSPELESVAAEWKGNFINPEHVAWHVQVYLWKETEERKHDL